MNADHTYIAGLLDTAQDMPADLKNNPVGLMRHCLAIVEEHPNNPLVLRMTIETCLLFVAARHKRRIVAQLKQAAREERKGMH